MPHATACCLDLYSVGLNPDKSPNRKLSRYLKIGQMDGNKRFRYTERSNLSEKNAADNESFKR